MAVLSLATTLVMAPVAPAATVEQIESFTIPWLNTSQAASRRSAASARQPGSSTSSTALRRSTLADGRIEFYVDRNEKCVYEGKAQCG